MTMGNYVRTVFVICALAMGSLLACMRWMDPFYYYGSADRLGVNYIRYGAVDYPELAKIYSVQWYRPRSLILGSSRAQIGLDPAHKGFLHQPVYSLAYPGSSMRRTLALFQHAIAISEIEQVVLAVDFFMFRASAATDAEFARLAVLPDGAAPDPLMHWRARALDFWHVNFSSTALKLAANDLLTNAGLLDLRAMRWIMKRNGHNELLHAQKYSYESTFDAVEASFARDYASGAFCLSLQPGASSLGDLRLLVERARDAGIDLRIVISPAHAGLAEVIDSAGLGQMWEDWKREIVHIAAEAASPNWSPLVFDFSGYNAITTEPVPIGATERQMNNYWDPSHYKRDVGNMILDLVLGRSPSAASGFGELVSPTNIDRHLSAIRRDRASWRVRAPDQLARIKRLTKPPQRDCGPL